MISCRSVLFRWAVAVVPNESYTVFIVHEERAEEIKYAWHFLMKYGQQYAKAHDVQPEKLILGKCCLLSMAIGVDARLVQSLVSGLICASVSGAPSSQTCHTTRRFPNDQHPPLFSTYQHRLTRTRHPRGRKALSLTRRPRRLTT